MLEGREKMSEITITKNNFKEEVLEYKGLVLVDFWASWCAPCKMLAPVVHQIAEEYADILKVGKINIDEEMELAQEYRILSIPTLVLFQEGKPVKQSVGYVGKDEIEQMWK